MLDKNPWQAGQRTKQLPFKCFKKENNNESKMGTCLLNSSFYLISNSLSIIIYCLISGIRQDKVLDEVFSWQ